METNVKIERVTEWDYVFIVNFHTWQVILIPH
jgi:hypothetical protein